MKAKEMIKYILPVLIILMMFLTGASVQAAAVGLLDISWEDQSPVVMEKLTKSTFALKEEGAEETGRSWQKYSGGTFARLPAQVETYWKNSQLTEVRVEAKGDNGVEEAYNQVMQLFTMRYGQPAQSHRYMLKSFPGILVESSSWQVIDSEGREVVIIVGLHQPERVEGWPEREARLGVQFSLRETKP